MEVPFALVVILGLLLYFFWPTKSAQAFDLAKFWRLFAKGSAFDKLKSELACTHADLTEVLAVKPAEPLLEQLQAIQTELAAKTAHQLLQTCRPQSSALKEPRVPKERGYDGLSLVLQQSESDKSAMLQRSQGEAAEDLQRKLKQTQRVIQSYECQVTGVWTKLAQQTAQSIETLNRTEEELRKQLRRLDAANKQLKKNNQELTKRNSALEQESWKLRSGKVVEKTEETRRLQESEQEDLYWENLALRQELNIAGGERAWILNRLQNAESSATTLNQANLELEQKLDIAGKEKSSLLSRLQDGESNTAALHQANLALRQDLDTARKENVSLLSRLQDAESSATNLFLALEAEKKQRNSLTKQLKQTQKDAETWKKGQSTLQKKLTQVQSQAASTTRKLQEWEKSDEERCCVVCLESLKGVLFEPCQHVCTCTRCSEQMTHCPMCREAIQSKRKIFS